MTEHGKRKKQSVTRCINSEYSRLTFETEREARTQSEPDYHVAVATDPMNHIRKPQRFFQKKSSMPLDMGIPSDKDQFQEGIVSSCKPTKSFLKKESPNNSNDEVTQNTSPTYTSFDSQLDLVSSWSAEMNVDNNWDGTFRNLTSGGTGIENRSDTVMGNRSDVLANKWGGDEESATVATDLAEIVSDTELIGMIRSSSFVNQEASRDEKVFVDSSSDSSLREKMFHKHGDFCALADFCENEDDGLDQEVCRLAEVEDTLREELQRTHGTLFFTSRKVSDAIMERQEMHQPSTINKRKKNEKASIFSALVERIRYGCCGNNASKFIIDVEKTPI